MSITGLCEGDKLSAHVHIMVIPTELYYASLSVVWYKEFVKHTSRLHDGDVEMPWRPKTRR